MKKILHFILFGTALGSLQYCSSPNDPVSLNTNYLYTSNTGSGGSTTGSNKIIHTASSGTKTLTFTLNNSKFVKLSASDNSIEHNLSYNSANKVQQVTGFTKDSNNNAVTTFNSNLLYDATGQLIGLSGWEKTGSDPQIPFTTTFTYTGGRLTKAHTVRTFQAAGLSFQNVLDNELTYTGANITKYVTTATNNMPNLPSQTVVTTTNHSNFDSKVNLAKGIPMEYSYFLTYNSIGALQSSINANNAGKVEVSVLGNTMVNLNNVYTYDSDNYPVTNVSTGTSSGTTSFTYQPW